MFTGLSTAEVLDHELNEWRPISPMNTQRSSVGVAVLGGESLHIFKIFFSKLFSMKLLQILNRSQLLFSKISNWTLPTK